MALYANKAMDGSMDPWIMHKKSYKVEFNQINIKSGGMKESIYEKYTTNTKYKGCPNEKWTG